jgi:glycosyltransferase involved in cell wall biosynthesis
MILFLNKKRMKNHCHNTDFEILISTMNRDSLEFLNQMFIYESYESFNLLIINQTTEGQLLVSNSPNVRVINSFEKGLSNSRNLALKNAIGHLCLIADDDVVYAKGFKALIVSSFENHKECDVITFKMMDSIGVDFKAYPNTFIVHTKKTLQQVNSVVIAFKRQPIQTKNIYFNTLFGLGSEFQTADEYIFLRDALKVNLTLCFQPDVILKHADYSSGQNYTSDNIIYARAAFFYKYSGFFGYLRLIKHVIVVGFESNLSLIQVIKKIGLGLKGIKQFKRLRNQ